jgi:hypothetical protein
MGLYNLLPVLLFAFADFGKRMEQQAAIEPGNVFFSWYSLSDGFNAFIG